MSAPVAPTVNRRAVGRYVISAELGHGAMGTVYLAEDPLGGHKVALKEFAFDQLPAGKADLRERIVRAAKAAARLDHPNIVTIHEVGACADGSPYIAMEALSGLTLSQSVDIGIVFPVPKVIDVAMRVLRGLDYAHQQGVVHGDIRPANIMLAHHGMVKIMDFGIGLAPGADETLDGSMPGAPVYLAPEQVTGGPTDARTDLFALGVTLYELLTGKNPFIADSLPMVMHNIVHLDPPAPATLNPEVPPGLDRVIMQALAKAPAARFANAGEMSRMLAPMCGILDDGGDNTGAERAPPGALDGATTATPSTSQAAGPSTGDATGARPFGWQELALWGAAVIVLGAVLGQVISPGDDAAPTPLPPAPLAAVPGAANLTRVDPASVAPTMARDSSPAEPVAPLPPTTPTEPAVAEAAESTAPAPAKDPVAPAPGQLKLAVSPWGEVYVNGRRRGVTPPLRVLELPPGTHRIEIRNAGLPPRIQRVTIESGKSVSIRHRFP